MWYLMVTTVFKSIGMKPMPHDACIFVQLKENTDEVLIVLSLHVDGTFLRGIPEACDALEKTQLRSLVR